MPDKPTPTTDLLKRCAEIHEWRSTGVLPGEALRDYAKRKWPDRHDTLQMAEHETVTEALAHERDRAIMEGERNASLTAFDHDGRLTLAEERLYEAAFTNGWDRHAAVVAPTSAPMSPANRLVAYSAATRLRELGFEWDATAEAWLQPASKEKSNDR